MASTVAGIVFGISLISLAYAGWLAREVLQSDTGTPAMKEIAAAIKEGAEAFVKRQYRTIAMLSVVLTVVIYLFYALSSSPNIRDLGPDIALKVAAAFVIGAACSAISGYVGMFVSIRANLRTAAAATSSLDRAMRIALRGGAVSGLTVVAMSLLGVGGLFYFYGGMERPDQVPLAGFLPRPRTLGRTSWARSKQEFRRTTHEIRQSLRTWWATMLETAPAAARICSNRPRRKISAP